MLLVEELDLEIQKSMVAWTLTIHTTLGGIGTAGSTMSK